MQRKLIPGAHLAIVAPAPAPTDENGAPTGDIPARFLAGVTAVLGPVEGRAWFRDATLVCEGGIWRLIVPTAFKADWIRARFQPALERGRLAAGLDGVPDVVARAR